MSVNITGLGTYRQRLNDERETLFGDWEVTDEVRAACWNNVAMTVDALIALGSKGTVKKATNILRRCIERFNELDTGFICTIEREELCDILYEIGDLCGLDSDEDWVDEWRDW